MAAFSRTDPPRAASWQAGQVEFPTRECRKQVPRNDARQGSPQSRGDHGSGHCRSVVRSAPDRERRFDPGAFQLPDAVIPDVFEEAVDERDCGDADRTGLLESGPHPGFVLVVRARPWHRPQRQTDSFRVGLHQFRSHGVPTHRVRRSRPISPTSLPTATARRRSCDGNCSTLRHPRPGAGRGRSPLTRQVFAYTSKMRREEGR